MVWRGMVWRGMVRVIGPSRESESTVHEEQVELAERYRDALREIAELEDRVPTEEEVERAVSYVQTLAEAAELEAKLAG